jgi:hypothetical protein
MALAFLTIGTVNHIPGIRVVLDTFAEHHPDAQLFTCLVDGDVLDHPDAELPGVVFSIKDMVLPGGQRFVFKFDAFELCCALKPFAASYILQRYGVERLVYLDSDVMVFGSLAESLSRGFRTGKILCTPHFVEWPQESPELLRQIRQCGTYNAGFFAVQDSPEARRFLSWWERICAEMGIYEPSTGRFVDQIWLDLVVAERHGFAEVLDPGLNVGYWNLAERILSKQGSMWMVNQQRLKFFHFSGFDPRRLTVRREYAPGDAHLALAEEYHNRLLAAGLQSLQSVPYGYATYSHGGPIAQPHRRAIFRGEPTLDAVDDPFKVRQNSEEWQRLLRASGEQVSDPRRGRRVLKRLRNRAVRAWKCLW